jgi:SAM-dependent methyltransferase
MTDFDRRSERTYYDSFFTSHAAAALDTGVGFQALREAQASFLKSKLKSLIAARTVLSIGCGNGEIELLLADPQWHLTAFDLSFAGPAAGQQRARQRPTTALSFGQAGVVELPIAANQADVVLALSVLHHLSPDMRERALREVYRVLRPGGWFIAYDPSRWRALRLLKFMVRRTYDALHSPDEEELSPHAMRQLAHSAGYGAVRIDYFDFFIDPLTWLIPTMSPRIFRVLYRLDRMLVHLPGKQFASNFFLLGRKPGVNST